MQLALLKVNNVNNYYDVITRCMTGSMMNATTLTVKVIMNVFS